VNYLLREGVIVVTNKTHQVIISSLSAQPVKLPLMKQVSLDNEITLEKFFFHKDGDVEVRACGF